jgi:uncharacterized protein (DUF2236 family)
MVLGRPLESLRRRVAREVSDAIRGPAVRFDAYREPGGDPGVIGPDSVAWRVHADLPGMLVGGFAALLLQTLHPQAMAAVDQHSAFREDPFGRLHRTSAFVAVSTFGSTPAFDAAAERVIRIHEAVAGIGPDGEPYEASDPALLTWVHVAEVSCFAAAYQQYVVPLASDELDRYFAETSVIAERLGATAVPKSAAEVEAYFARVRPELRATEPAFDALRFLRHFGANLPQRITIRILMNGAIGVLPAWARADLRIDRARAVHVLIDRPLMLAVAWILRWACAPSPIVVAAHERRAKRPSAAV